MDGVIETLIRTLVDPGETVAISMPTFSFYGLAAQAQGARVVTVPRRADFSVDIDALDPGGKGREDRRSLHPEQPDRQRDSVDDVQRILEEIKGILFLDNAYVEFSGIDYLPLMKKHENLVIGRTFSKVHSLAGLRIGYAFVPAWLRAVLPAGGNAVYGELGLGSGSGSSAFRYGAC